MKDQVRVLVVSPVPLVEGRIGGIANFIRGFIRHAPADFAVEVVGVQSGAAEGGGGWHELSLEGRAIRFLPVARVPTTRREGRVPTTAHMVAGMLRARRQIRVAGRVLQFHAPATDVPFALSRSPRVRVLHNTPADMASARSGSTWRHLPQVLRAVEQLSLDRMDVVFSVNRAAAETLAAGGGAAAERYRFLPNWVDTQRFRPLDAAEREAVRARLAAEIGIPADAPWLLFAGRLDPQKQPLLLVRTLAEARDGERAASARLLVAGEGSLRQETAALARELGVADRVHFLGVWPHERLSELMAASDLMLVTSAFEAGPTVAYESLAAGLPVVGTPVGELPQIVAQGMTGWVAEDHTPAALARGVALILDASRQKIAEQSAASMAPFHEERVLKPFYDEHRRLARRFDRVG